MVALFSEGLAKRQFECFNVTPGTAISLGNDLVLQQQGNKMATLTNVRREAGTLLGPVLSSDSEVTF